MTPVSSPTFAPATPPTLSPPRAAPMERRSSCDLFECIEQHNRFNEATARYVFAQIVDVVASLGAVGICHRDLKDENIVISSDFKVSFARGAASLPSETDPLVLLSLSLPLQVKLIDFGSAVIFDPRKPAPLYNRTFPPPRLPTPVLTPLFRVLGFYGTLSSAAPEILNSQDYNVFQAEIWSLGVLLNILLTGTAPFANKDAAKRGERSTPNAGRGKLSREASDLLDACFVVDPQNRITLEAIRRHSWMQLR
jgi:serine/threonine protein kinase